VGRGSVLGAAIRYGLDGPGIESRLGRDISQPSRQDLGSNEPPIQFVRSLHAGKAGAWRSQPTPHLMTRLKKEYSYTYTPPLGRNFHFLLFFSLKGMSLNEMGKNFVKHKFYNKHKF